MIVVAIIGMSTLGVAFIALISAMRPDVDNTLLIGTVLGFLAPSLLALVTLLKMNQLHVLVNSRLTQLLEKTELAAELSGRVAGKIEGKAELKAEQSL